MKNVSDGIKRPAPFEGYHIVIAAWLQDQNVLKKAQKGTDHALLWIGSGKEVEQFLHRG